MDEDLEAQAVDSEAEGADSVTVDVDLVAQAVDSVTVDVDLVAQAVDSVTVDVDLAAQVVDLAVLDVASVATLLVALVAYSSAKPMPMLRLSVLSMVMGTTLFRCQLLSTVGTAMIAENPLAQVVSLSKC